jgi:hypothetical protein
MRVRLTQPGFENFTGLLGVINFKEGVSVEDVPRFESLRLSAVMSCEGLNGEALSLAQEILDKGDLAAPIIPDRTGEDEPREILAPLPPESEPEFEEFTPETFAAMGVLPPGESEPVKLTQADLEAIADKALRDFADPLGIKGTSIVGLIRELIFAGHAVANPPAALE